MSNLPIFWQSTSQVNSIEISYSVIGAQQLPPLELTRAACAYIFNQENQLLLTKHSNPKRSWDLPGGHIEAGESAEQAVIREFLEETTILIKPVEVIAHIVFKVHSPKPISYHYPYPISYVPIFVGTIEQIKDFQPQPDAIDRGFYALANIPTITLPNSWLNQQTKLHYYALSQFKEIYG